jgi:hypothetical protein
LKPIKRAPSAGATCGETREGQDGFDGLEASWRHPVRADRHPARRSVRRRRRRPREHGRRGRPADDLERPGGGFRDGHFELHGCAEPRRSGSALRISTSAVIDYPAIAAIEIVPAATNVC